MGWGPDSARHGITLMLLMVAHACVCTRAHVCVCRAEELRDGGGV